MSLGVNANRPDKPPIGSPAATPTGSDAGARPTATVLVADDDPDMRLYVKRCLRALPRMNVVVLEAADGTDALARVQRGDVDLLISDLVMPRTDGFALCRAVRQDPSLGHVSILLVTGELSVREVKARAGEFGPIQVMSKPFNADQLNAKVTEMLGNAARIPRTEREPEEGP
jgi:CheY-like chemotaxis protein